MPEILIPGVKVKQLKVMPDERGRVMEGLRCDDSFFQKFGQVYITTVYPGVIKGWHYHKIQTDYVWCASGMIKLVLHDRRPAQEVGMTAGVIQEFYIGEHQPLMVMIPPGLHHGWKGIGEREAVVMCVATEPYNYAEPDEYRIDPHSSSIPYAWGRRDG